MGIPLRQIVDVGSYIVKKELSGAKRYPLVLMMEPLFRCNLACAGCGKIDYPDEILNKRISVEDALGAVDECGAPVVVIAGGEPLIHKELPEIVRGIMAKKKYAIVCTNAILLEKKLDEYEPNPYFTWSIHLDGDKEMHDKSVCRNGIYDKAVSALKEAKERGFRVTINCTFFNDADPERVAKFFDDGDRARRRRHHGVARLRLRARAGPEALPQPPDDQEHVPFACSAGQGQEVGVQPVRPCSSTSWPATRAIRCTPWGNPTRTVFGWQKPCYLLGEGYAKTFKELMEDTDWDNYGVGNYEKCADCMVHSGFEATAVRDTVRRPWKALTVALFGVRRKARWRRRSRSQTSVPPNTCSRAMSRRSSRRSAPTTSPPPWTPRTIRTFCATPEPGSSPERLVGGLKACHYGK